MVTQRNTQVKQCLALTVKKENRLTVVKKTARITLRMSVKTLLYVLVLMFANVIV